METVLITGGNGFIGSNLVKRIVELSEWKVRVLILQGTRKFFLTRCEIRLKLFMEILLSQKLWNRLLKVSI